MPEVVTPEYLEVLDPDAVQALIALGGMQLGDEVMVQRLERFRDGSPVGAPINKELIGVYLQLVWDDPDDGYPYGVEPPGGDGRTSVRAEEICAWRRKL